MGRHWPWNFYTCEVFRIFVALVVILVAQLRPLPESFGAAESRACSKLFPGPSSWTTPALMAQLRSVGFPRELQDIRCAARAARARVAHFEDIQHGGLRVRGRARRLRELMLGDERGVLPPEVEAWLQANTVFVLQESEEHAHDAERRHGLPSARAASVPYKLRVKASGQATRMRALLADRPRTSLTSGPLSCPTGAECNVSWLACGSSARPRHRASWPPPCALPSTGGSRSGDFNNGGRASSVAPWAATASSTTPIGSYHRWCAEQCALARPPASRCLSNLLGLSVSTGSDWAGSVRTSAELDFLRACCGHISCKAHLAVRRRAISSSEAGSFFAAALKEACKNEPLSRLC